MTLYVDCPTCPKYRPDFEVELVVKGQKYCRRCKPHVEAMRRKRRKRR